MNDIFRVVRFPLFSILYDGGGSPVHQFSGAGHFERAQECAAEMNGADENEEHDAFCRELERRFSPVVEAAKLHRKSLVFSARRAALPAKYQEGCVPHYHLLMRLADCGRGEMIAAEDADAVLAQYARQANAWMHGALRGVRPLPQDEPQGCDLFSWAQQKGGAACLPA